MNAKILEIFNSIQGEGKYAGVNQVFVRFFECNIHCSWCDTPHSIGDTTRQYKEYTLPEVTNAIDGLWPGAHSVSLTGGEPLLQAEFLRALLPQLKKKKQTAYLETNGVLPDALVKVIDDIDIVAMDIKLPSSTECQPFWEEHAAFLQVARQKEVFIKAVVSSKTQEEDITKAVRLVADIDPGILFILQPNYFDMKNGVLDKCQAYQRLGSQTLRDVRVLPQVHKFMKVR